MVYTDKGEIVLYGDDDASNRIRQMMQIVSDAYERRMPPPRTWVHTQNPGNHPDYPFVLGRRREVGTMEWTRDTNVLGYN